MLTVTVRTEDAQTETVLTEDVRAEDVRTQDVRTEDGGRVASFVSPVRAAPGLLLNLTAPLTRRPRFGAIVSSVRNRH